MKKLSLVLALTLILSLFGGCGNSEPAVTAPEGTTGELITKIYENVTVDLPLTTIAVDLNDEYSVSAYTGLNGAESIAEASASESMIGAQAYSLVLVRLKDAQQAETVAQSRFDNIDTRKWICVEATEKQVAVCGDLVMLIMLSPEYGVTSAQIVEAFTTVCGGSLSKIIQ